jgi:murein DD-endopeptidase MepM/ murein hydrolase activator NlpD
MVRVCALLAYLVLSGGALPAAAQLALPVAPTCVTSPFGERHPTEPRAAHFHSGVDLRAAAGAWVHAAAAGTVVAIRRRGSAGLEVEVKHSPTMTTRYDHLGTVAPALQSGKRLVAKGDILGRVGRTGITYGTHLHFELQLNGTVVDSAPFLGVTPCQPAL